MTSKKPALKRSEQIRSVQALRALAALFVVVYHVTVLWHDKVPLESIKIWENGSSGVDLFFVISGFIMVLSSRRLRQQADGWSKFIRARLIRVVPLYWLTTSIKLILVTAVPTLALHTHTDAWNAVASFLFVPSHDTAGNIIPVLVVGWTLSFEMLFYATFAAALFLSLNPFLVVAPAMAALATLSLARQSSWPAIAVLADPIIFEFVFGMLVGSLFLARDLPQVSRPIVILVGILSLLALAFLPMHGPWNRVLIWGAPAAATLWAALAIEPWVGHTIPKPLVAVGEASYSLYLTHGFVLPVMGVAITAAHLPPLATGMALISACLIASTTLSLLIHRYVEAPITRWFQASLDQRQSSSLAAPQALICHDRRSRSLSLLTDKP